jgi:hypothetical protein
LNAAAPTGMSDVVAWSRNLRDNCPKFSALISEQLQCSFPIIFTYFMVFKFLFWMPLPPQEGVPPAHGPATCGTPGKLSQIFCIHFRAFIKHLMPMFTYACLF